MNVNLSHRSGPHRLRVSSRTQHIGVSRVPGAHPSANYTQKLKRGLTVAGIGVFVAVVSPVFEVSVGRTILGSIVTIPFHKATAVIWLAPVWAVQHPCSCWLTRTEARPRRYPSPRELVPPPGDVDILIRRWALSLWGHRATRC